MCPISWWVVLKKALVKVVHCLILEEGIMITSVCSFPVHHGLVFVLEVVLNVAHFVVGGREEFTCYGCTLFDPKSQTKFF